jgi:uncharacterized membrane protein YjfL (UPF0719 family)
MSGDETLVLVVSAAFSLGCWGFWYAPMLSVRLPDRGGGPGGYYWLVPPACGGLLFGLLRLLAADDVRTAPEYLLMYTLMGGAWVGVLAMSSNYLGIHHRDDAVERRNGAAAIALSGLLVGATLAFAGGNMGNGPGWWVVVFSSGLATVTLLLVWSAYAGMTSVVEWITLDHSHAAGLRAAGVLVGCGLIAGRAAAGNWVSAEAALVDFALRCWPVLLVLGAAVMIEKALPAPEAVEHAGRRWANAGVAALFVLIGASAVALQGGW